MHPTFADLIEAHSGNVSLHLLRFRTYEVYMYQTREAVELSFTIELWCSSHTDTFRHDSTCRHQTGSVYLTEVRGIYLPPRPTADLKIRGSI